MKAAILIIVAVLLMTVSIQIDSKYVPRRSRHMSVERSSTRPCRDCLPGCNATIGCPSNAFCANSLCQCHPPRVIYYQECKLPLGADCSGNATSTVICVPQAVCIREGEVKTCKCRKNWVPGEDLRSCMVPQGGECDANSKWETPSCTHAANCIPDVNILGMYTADSGLCVLENGEGLLQTFRRKAWTQWIVLVVGIGSVFLVAAIFLHRHRRRHEFPREDEDDEL